MTARARAHRVRVGDILESLAGRRRVEVIEAADDGDPWRDVRLRNLETGREWACYSANLWTRYRVVSRGAESDIVREAGEVR